MGDCILLDQKILSYEECKNFSLPEGSRATYEEIDMGKFVPKTDSPDGHNNSKEHYEEAKQVRNTDQQADADYRTAEGNEGHGCAVGGKER